MFYPEALVSMLYWQMRLFFCCYLFFSRFPRLRWRWWSREPVALTKRGGAVYWKRWVRLAQTGGRHGTVVRVTPPPPGGQHCQDLILTRICSHTDDVRLRLRMIESGRVWRIRQHTFLDVIHLERQRQPEKKKNDTFHVWL